MIIIRAIAFLLHFTLVPVAIGRLITYKSKDSQHHSPIVTYILGMAGALGIFYILNCGFYLYQNVTMITELVKGGFHRLCITYSVIVILLVALWIYLEIKNKTAVKSYFKNWFDDVIKSFKEDKLHIVYAIIFIALLFFQMYMSLSYEINEWSYDDYEYVATSLDDINTDMITNVNFVTGEAPFTTSKRVAQAWTTYVAYLSVVSSFEVTTVCHTILPVLLLAVAYGIYYYIARFLFDKSDNRIIFMILLEAVFIMGNFSHYSPTFRLLCALWQGKAVLSAIFIPFMICYMVRAFSIELSNRVTATIAILSVGAASLAGISMGLVSLTVIGMFIMMAVYNRKIYGIRYLLAGLAGPAVQGVMYVLSELLLTSQWS